MCCSGFRNGITCLYDGSKSAWIFLPLIKLKLFPVQSRPYLLACHVQMKFGLCSLMCVFFSVCLATPLTAQTQIIPTNVPGFWVASVTLHFVFLAIHTFYNPSRQAFSKSSHHNFAFALIWKYGFIFPAGGWPVTADVCFAGGVTF